MANRKIREISEIYGGSRSANDLIRNQLTKKDGQMFGEIMNYLKSNGLTYTKRGLYKRLDSLVEAKIIEKREGLKPYPTYHLVRRSDDYSGLGFWLKYCFGDIFWKELLWKLNIKQEFRAMCTLIGLYTIFADIQSWKLVSDKKSYAENFAIRSSFLRNALPLVTRDAILEIDGRKSEGVIPQTYTKKEIKKQILEFEREMMKAFPAHMKLIQSAFEQARIVAKIGRRKI